MIKKYVIRFSNGSESDPLSKDEVINRIRKNEITSNDEIAEQPGQHFVPILTVSEFESVFLSEQDEEKTLIFDSKRLNNAQENADDEKTKVGSISTVFKNEPNEEESLPIEPQTGEWVDKQTQQQKTIVIDRPKELLEKDSVEPKRRFNLPKKSFLVMILLCIVAYEYMFEDEDDAPTGANIVLKPVRPQLPSGGVKAIDPEKSTKIYSAALRYYSEDTVQGYRKTVDGLQLALQADPQNVKALAMLASTYINLIDSSNKDENTYTVINKLIELSHTKDVDLVETLIAEVEFLSISKRYDAGIQRLVDFYKVSGKFDAALYYYLAWLYSLKREYASAMKYLNQIPASALPIPKLYYLRGFIHEESNELDEAKAEYVRALKLNPRHAKSILGLVRVADKKGELKTMVRHVEFLTANPSLQAPPEYVRGLIYKSKLALLFHRPDLAVKSLQEAIKIEPKNEDLKLEYYTILSSADDKSQYRDLAKMFALVLEGERLTREQKFHEASAVILQAKDAFPKSEVPLEKMGDLFFHLGQFQKAKQNFEKAIEISPKSGEIAIKLIDSLIKNHDYDEAQKYLAKYRTHPRLKSSIDRLAGDLAFQQGIYQQAITYYRKAMARDTIDTDVYSAYANTLRELDQCKDAQFFYMLAQRLDPFSSAAIIGSAKCLLKTDGTLPAVSRIQDELSKMLKARVDLIAGIAEIYFLANEYERALQFTAQAKDLDPEYPDTYRIEGETYLKLAPTRKEFQKKALEALKAYSDRKVSDPYGYLQRFEIFLKESNFDMATAELNRIFDISPQFPELHFRRAQLYSRMGRSKDAIQELDQELKLNPRFTKALVELGNLYVRLGNLDEALKNYMQVMEIDPQNAQAKVGAGFVNYQRRQFSSAIALYMAALGLDKGNPEIYKKLGMAYRDSGDSQKAAQAFRSYLDLAPDAPDRNEYEQYR